MRSTLDEFKEYFDCYEDSFDRTHAIMDLGKNQVEFGQQPDAAILVPGCQSRLYVWGNKDSNSQWQFYTTSDGLFSGGMAHLAVLAANGHTSEELADFGLDWFSEFNLSGLMTSGRMNGFYNLIKVMHKIILEK